MTKESAASVLGRVGRPAPLKELAAKTWDAIVVGAGHNGLTCAAYLAKAGLKTLVLEAREGVGGACTLEEVMPGVRMSPCAYVVGLLHPLVMRELDMKGHGFAWTPADGGMFVPFPDGSSVQLWNDDAKCEEEIRRFSPRDVEGWKAFGALKKRVRDKLRPEGAGDIWVGASPSRAAIEDRLAGDPLAKKLMFEWSMVECLEHFFQDERLQLAYMGQGVIGTNASPYEPGTAYVHFHHASGRMDGLAGTWGYVKGGMGRVSFILYDIAKEAGAVIAPSSPVARIIPGEGVELESGERFHAKSIVSNADPRVTLRLLGDRADPAFKEKAERIPIKGCTMKINLALRELPNFKARPGTNEPHHLGQVNTPLTKTEWHEAHRIAAGGEIPPKLWTELYFHTAYDTSVSRDGIHTMSVFAQYVPNEFAQGTWDTRRDDVAKVALDSIGAYVSNFPDVILHREVMGPPDIERKVGLTGGHIFQGEILPQYLWDSRPQARIAPDGVYLCGSGAHPGGSVIAINGRNAAMAVLEDRGIARPA